MSVAEEAAVKPVDRPVPRPSGDTAAKVAAKNPFVGPRPFTRSDPLFGRARETAELVDLLLSERIVLLHAPSGAGKTSLLQAGVVPALEREGFRILPVIRVGLHTSAERRRSTNRYVESALTSLDASPGTGDGDAATLAQRVDSLPPLAEDRSGTVLVFDQFEELLTLDVTDDGAKKAFLEDVSRLLAKKDRVWAVFAIREDYLGALRPYQLLVPTRLRVAYRLGLLAREEAREAIVKPAGDGFFPGPLVDELLEELSKVRVLKADGAASELGGAAIEPVLLQVVCLREWARIAEKKGADEREPVATRVDDALSRYYSDAVARATKGDPAVERALRRFIDDELVVRGKVRGQAMMPDVSVLPEFALSTLLDAYVLRKDERRGVVWLELSHDRLLAAVHDDNARWFGKNLEPFQAQAIVWMRHGRHADYVLRGEALRAAERWLEDHEHASLEVERDFVLASQVADRARARTRQRNLIGVLFLGVLTVLALLLALFVSQRKQRAAAEALLDEVLDDQELQKAEELAKRAREADERSEEQKRLDLQKKVQEMSLSECKVQITLCEGGLVDRKARIEAASKHILHMAVRDAVEGRLSTAQQNIDAACRIDCTREVEAMKRVLSPGVVAEYRKVVQAGDESGIGRVRREVLSKICTIKDLAIPLELRQRIHERATELEIPTGGCLQAVGTKK